MKTFLLIFLLISNLYASQENVSSSNSLHNNQNEWLLTTPLTKFTAIQVHDFLFVETRVINDYVIDESKLKKHRLEYNCSKSNVHKDFTDKYQYEYIWDQNTGKIYIIMLIQQNKEIYLMRFHEKDKQWRLAYPITKLPIDGILGHFMIYVSNGVSNEGDLRIQYRSTGHWVDYSFGSNQIISIGNK